MISYDRRHLAGFVDDAARAALQPRLEAAHTALLNRTGAGAEMLGWRSLLSPPDATLLADVAAVAAEIRERADVLVCIGIGGSYLGAQAVIDALSPYFRQGGPEILFAGHHISAQYHRELLAHLEGKSVYVNVISKSGTTLEPALAFRFLRTYVEEHFPDPERRIIATTDQARGVLKRVSTEKGYRTFVIPDDVGGRFSVLTPVGLLPIATAGLDIHGLVGGAAALCQTLSAPAASGHPVFDYAADRFLLHEQGYKTDLMAVFEAKLRGIGFWWQQLFGESEGKQHQGLFPTVAQYSTDLHSIGQYVQDGQRTLIETFLLAETPPALAVPHDPANADGLNYLAGQDYGFVNHNAYLGTAKAHYEGGVPNATLTLSALDAPTLGEALYFFEHAVALGGYLLGINPFDQPGVEAYKKEMYKLLGL